MNKTNIIYLKQYREATQKKKETKGKIFCKLFELTTDLCIFFCFFIGVYSFVAMI